MNRLRKLGLELRLMSSGHRAEFLWTLPLVLTLTKHGVRPLPCRNIDGDAVLCRAVWLRSALGTLSHCHKHRHPHEKWRNRQMWHYCIKCINLWKWAAYVGYNLEKDLFCFGWIFSHSSNNLLKLKSIICFFYYNYKNCFIALRHRHGLKHTT